MKGGPLRWVVAFFTRPIHLSDLKAVGRALKPRPKVKVEAKEAAPVIAPERPPRPRAKVADVARPLIPPAHRASFDVAVSDVPLDTLPADLQSEFGMTTSPAPLDAKTTPRGGPSDA
jgi:hypothetical protein